MISRTADCAAPCQTKRQSVPQPSEGEVAVLVTSRQGNVAITPELLLPELLRLHPETRIVFDRHGLRGCGGPLGPYESIRFFARAHGVDELLLLDELRQAIATPRSQPRRDATDAGCPGDRRYDLPPLLPGRDRGRALGWGELGSLAALDDRPERLVPGGVGPRDQCARRGPGLRLGRVVHHGVCLSGVSPDLADDAGLRQDWRSLPSG